MIAKRDSWRDLRKLTSARIAIGRTGGSCPTHEQLAFRLAHARARDAVLAPFHHEAFAAQLAAAGHDSLALESAATNRFEYLQRPDLGRRLSVASRGSLESISPTAFGADLVLIVSDGLSTLAAQTQVLPVLAALLPELRLLGWRLAPIFVVRHARVALQDEVGGLLGARLSLMLLGERPGLGSPDSLGAYFTHSPAVGKTDADRNCISNIRPGGLHPLQAANKLILLLLEARHLGLSGVALKDTQIVPSISIGNEKGGSEVTLQ